MTGEEKRKYVRLNAVYPVELLIVGDGNEPVTGLLQGFTRNISFEGLCLEINSFDEQYLPALQEKRYKITLHLNIPLHRQPVKACGRVVWACKTSLPHPQSYVFGVAYEAIDALQQRRILRFARFSRIAPRAFAAAGLALLLAAGLIFWNNIMLTRHNHLLVQELTVLSGQREDLERSLDSLKREKSGIEESLRQSMEQVNALKSEMERISGRRAEELRRKDETAAANLLRELKMLEGRLAGAMREKEILREQLGALRRSETRVETDITRIDTAREKMQGRTVRLMYQWLIANQNAQTGLVRSYDAGTAWSDAAFTYDQALSAFTFMHFSDYGRAEKIFDFYRRRAERMPGGFANAYDVVTGKVGEYVVHSGPAIYLGLALLRYERQTGKTVYQPLLREISAGLLRLMQENRGRCLPGGPGLSWVSTEHNLAAYAFFRAMFEYTREERYGRAKEALFSWLRDEGYNQKLERFNRGAADRMIATDTVSLGVLVLSAAELEQMGIDPLVLLRCAEENCRTSVRYKNMFGKKVLVTGFDFCNPSSVGRAGVISGEWTAQMALAYRVLSDKSGKDEAQARRFLGRARYYLAELEKMFIVRSAFGAGGSGGLPYASEANVDTGHGWWTPEREAVSAASTNFAIFAREGYNMFKI